MDISTGRIEANGVDFAYEEAGSGPLALCLHGFPDSPRSWRFLMSALAGAGFRAVAPYQRGYSPTRVLEGSSYQTGALALDACALHEALGGGADSVIIGHDWGALGTYGAASMAPDRWSRVVASAVPPAPALAAGFLDYRQLKRSWYQFLFLHPMAEVVVPMDDMAFIDHLWADWSPGFDAGDETAAVKDALRDPANLSAALGYYRAQWGTEPPSSTPELDEAQAAVAGIPPQPTLYLHGVDDGCIGAELAAGVGDLLSEGSRSVVVEGCGHFLHVERPDEVNRLVIDFLTA